MLLIVPPVAKPCEPPAGIARLAGVLHAHGIPCRLFDANLEGMLALLAQPPTVTDTWSRRAGRSRERHLAALRDPRSYGTPDRYRRAVGDLNRLLAVAAKEYGATAGLADYQHATLSPLRSADLLAAAERPEQNPFYPFFSRRLPELLDDHAAAPVRVAGFSLNFLSQALCTFAMIGFLRRRYPAVRIVLGGGLVTSWLARPGWRTPFAGVVDDLIAGPGELPLLELAGAAPTEECRALPAYGSLPLADYLSPGVILPYSAAGGCWWNRCSFCPERAEGNPYRPLPPTRAGEELRALTTAHRPGLIHLLDNAVSPALLRELAQTPPGAPWYGFVRFGPELADEEFCHALRRSGCVMLRLGLESGDQGVLDRLQKGIDLGMASRVLTNLRRAGIATYCYLLFGTPAEDEAAARRTLEFVVAHREAIRFLNLAVFNMPAFGEEAAEYGTEPFYAGDLSLYTGFRHPRGWDRQRVRRFLNREFARHPAVAAILRNDPPCFTSNHAPFFGGE
ncbi:B12-binding domain-containing radical SAM protein [Geobacter pickeringii]|uniref:Radical SAM protein n=1 Tax=Geobacter pickeringii TaxID=345632 RepID=A0A0B5BDU5_9BACT|nr:radical SAM protein [Geobacter pickeringii]